MEPPSFAQLREIVERAEVGNDGLFVGLMTPTLVLNLLDLVEERTTLT